MLEEGAEGKNAAPLRPPAPAAILPLSLSWDTAGSCLGLTPLRAELSSMVAT